MTRPILLDTCALIWLANKDSMRDDAMEALAEAELIDDGILVSPITAWEIGLLVSRGRLVLDKAPTRWFREAIESGVVLAPMPPEVLIASSCLPGSALRDPADRTIAVTARTYGYRLMTRDRPLLDYAEAGHLQAIAC